MSKTKEELELLKQECETLNNKLKELTDDELGFVIGGLAVEGNILGCIADVSSMLQGKVAGLNIVANGGKNETPTIVLRGCSEVK